MRSIILAMLRQPLAQRLIAKLNKAVGVRAIYESDYDKVLSAVSAGCADTILIEIAEKGIYDAEFCLALCATLRRETPDCRLLLLCPEKDETSVSAVLRGRRGGWIDDFLFYDASIDFLVSKLLVSPNV